MANLCKMTPKQTILKGHLGAILLNTSAGMVNHFQNPVSAIDPRKWSFEYFLRNYSGIKKGFPP